MAFQRVNTAESIGPVEGVRVMIAASTYPHPVDLANFFNLSTYDPDFSTYGWVDVGSTDGPVSHQISANMNEWRNDQTGRYRTVPVDYQGQVSGTFLEPTQQNKVNLRGATALANAPSGAKVTIFEARGDVPEVHLALAWYDHRRRLHVHYFPRAFWNGDAVNTSEGRGERQTIPMTWTIYGSETLTGPNGAVLQKDFDQ